MGEPELAVEDTTNPASDTSSTTTVRRRRRRSTSTHTSSRTKRSRLRAIYFSLAALWGFLAGTGAVLVGLAAAGNRPEIDRFGNFCIACAAVVALVGGVVAAMAYRSAVRRIR